MKYNKIFANELPAAIKAFVMMHFPMLSIAFAEKGVSSSGASYLISLNDGTDKHHFTWTHLVEAKDMMAWIGYEGFPLTIVVDKKGIVRHAVHGTTNETKREELLAKIKEVEAE